MSTSFSNTDDRGTYHERSGVEVSRLSSAAKDREVGEAVGITATVTSRTFVSPLNVHGGVVYLPEVELHDSDVAMIEYSEAPAYGLICNARTAKTCI